MNSQLSHQPALARQRLASLDILRGLDLFLLVFLQPVLVGIGRAADWPWLQAVLYQLDHEVWEGFRFWDLVMPLFLFMVGASMPFSFAKFRTMSDGRRLAYRKIVRRFLMLFLFGMIVQGNLLGLDPDAIYIYNNTLQSIAVGYLIAAVTLLHCRWRAQIAITALLLVTYWLPMAWWGDYSPTGNFAYRVDELVIGRFRGDLTYTWVWSSLTFGATVLLGALAGNLIKNPRRSRPHTAVELLVTGAVLTAAGLLWGLEMPIIKRLWTSSMTLFAGGICFMVMAAFYWWIDVRGHSRGLNWLKIYGMNPITAYLLGEVINFRSIVASVSYGLQPHIGPEWYAAWLTFGNFLILLLILLLMYRREVFLKV